MGVYNTGLLKHTMLWGLRQLLEDYHENGPRMSCEERGKHIRKVLDNLSQEFTNKLTSDMSKQVTIKLTCHRMSIAGT